MDLWNFWDRYTHASETRVWLEKAVAQPGLGVSPIRIQALRMANYLALRQVDYPGAKAWAERSLAMAEETGDRWEITRSLNHLAITALLQGDYDSGRSLLEACLAGYRELRREEYIPGILNNLGELARYQGDFEHAVALYEETLAHFKASGERIGTMVTMESLGYAQYHLGLFHEARATLFEALTLARDTDSLMHVAVILASLGGVIIARLDRTGVRSRGPWSRLCTYLGFQRSCLKASVRN
jgi:tetratricopeptide (TPR) repeat protein